MMLLGRLVIAFEKTGERGALDSRTEMVLALVLG